MFVRTALSRPYSSILRASVHLQPLRRSLNISTLLSENCLPTLFEEPSWSVNSLLDVSYQVKPVPAITQTQLHRLLRLSALPPPTSEDEEAKILKTLASQLHFVQAIQNIDTTGIEPLRSIKDETTQAKMENEINLDSLKEEFGNEEIVGPSRRIRRKQILPVATSNVENWDALFHVPKKVGRYIVVETGKQ
ncbi:hypothetical protein MMC14_010381 [Varicellaria rhodocarpa]|nr:hypothetical protein [Varicellaria rhodocarpa]